MNQGDIWGFANFVRRNFLLDEKKGFLAEGNLTLSCEVSVFEEFEHVTGNTTTGQTTTTKVNRIYSIQK